VTLRRRKLSIIRQDKQLGFEDNESRMHELAPAAAAVVVLVVVGQ